jgi:proteic killer suppression protein
MRFSEFCAHIPQCEIAWDIASRGEEKGRWSTWVNGNWRLTFEFRDGHAYVLDYEDYH